MIYRLFEITRSEISRWRNDKVKADSDRKGMNYNSILDDEIASVIAYRTKNDENRNMGYKKLTWKMVDECIVFLSESSIYRILSKNRLLGKAFKARDGASDEYTNKPQYVHHHWHTDIAYVVVNRVHYYMVIMLDGYSRYLLGFELMTDMLSKSVALFAQKVKEKYPETKPMIIHDNGSQFISKDFKDVLSENECIDVPTKVKHPETNGKAERVIGIVRQEALRPESPTYYKEAQSCIEKFVSYYNNERLHAGINYLKPVDVFTGNRDSILKERQDKLKVARAARIERNKCRIKNIPETIPA
jgi:transposase InsO family protein